MQVLLDTNALIWWLDLDSRLGSEALALLKNPETVVWFSTINIVECQLKIRLGRLKMPANYVDQILLSGFREMPIQSSHADLLPKLKTDWNDPFDLLLVGQSVTEGAALLTSDSNILGLKFPGFVCLDARS